MCAAVSGLILGAGMAAYQIGSGIKAKNDAYEEMNEYERQDLKNAFEDVQLSTLGADLLREQTGAQAAQLVDAAQAAGSRGVASSIPKIQTGLNQANQIAAQNLDAQNQRREYAIAGDETRIQGIKENRDVQNIAAISSQIQAADQNIQNGILGGMSALMYGARAMEGSGQKTNEDPFAPENFNETDAATNISRAETPIFSSNPVSAPKAEIKANLMPANYASLDPFAMSQINTANIWGADPYDPEFYNKYFNV